MAMPNSRLSNAELRCCCGSLVARVTARGIELKCRRCKRIVLVPADSAQHGWVAVPVHAEGAMRR